MKTISKIFVTCAVVSAVVSFAQVAQAAQNSSYPSPSRCNGAAWSIGLPSGVTCGSTVTTAGALESDSKASSIFGANSRLKPDLTSLNKFCQQYTGDSTAYAYSASVHNFCSACDQKISWWTGSSWTTQSVCAGTLNVQNVTCKTGCSTTPVCTSHYTKKCVSNSVYWYDSCNNKEGLYQACSANQICQSGACVDQNITCNSNSDCGTSGYTGSPFCQGSSVYQNYKTYTCNNAGTAISACSDSVTAKLKQACSANQICQSGACVDQNITCNSNSDCGTSGYTGSPYCQGSNVFQNYMTYTCNSAGTANSYCSDSSTSQLKQTCSGNQTCSNGVCSGQNCTYHSYQQCNGNYLYWYDSCGNQQDSQYCQNGCYGNQCQNYNNVTVQTNSATNNYNNQTTLNGYLYNANNSCNAYVWFEYGQTTTYGYQTTQQSQNYSGSFNQVVNLYNNYNNYNNYHFRAAAKDCSGNTIYGQDTTFTNGTGTETGYLTVNETVRNLTTGSGFANSVSASPGDVLMFMITIQTPTNQTVSNIVLRDNFPANLIYKDQLIVSGTNNYSGDIVSGLNINSISGGQTATITYQAQLASAPNFAYGTTTINDNISVTSSNSGYTPVNNASVIVTRAGVYGASTISTGLTNNFWVDSFFLPLLIALIGIWMWKSGMFFGVEKWLINQKKIRNSFKSERELNKRIAAIKNLN